MTTTPALNDDLAKDRADWLLDAVACATQDRRFLRGEPEYDDVAGDAILMNGEKAIRVALEAQSKEIEALRSALEWREISKTDVPPHEVPVLLYSPPSLGHPEGLIEARPFSSGRSGDGWSERSYHAHATHWMPLPGAPRPHRPERSLT